MIFVKLLITELCLASLFSIVGKATSEDGKTNLTLAVGGIFILSIPITAIAAVWALL